ncbi:unnamed protein product [Callosobruchus maculatus]|uniref:Peptidoglycan-recognition protein n=1 Tax=Callosobruchus maculatus TaxID=64391 RepID=A0A653BM56_CALMS|nr:unnamed protein product [Callosobruchus maculatus]
MHSRSVVAVILIAYSVMCEKSDDGACPIISRKEWGAVPPKSVKPLEQNPPLYIVVHHSASPICTSEDACKRSIRGVQRYHMENRGWEDIGYNFMIGGDGNIYEGRGWGVHGAHDPRHNANSLGVCLFGNFEETEPLDVQLEALKKFISCAASTNKVKVDYRLIGHKQSKPTLCPGKNLFKIIKTYPHFYDGPN